jgi:hypothetical protein
MFISKKSHQTSRHDGRGLPLDSTITDSFTQSRKQADNTTAKLREAIPNSARSTEIEPSTAFWLIAQTARKICETLNAETIDEGNAGAARNSIQKTLADAGGSDWNKALMQRLLVRGLSEKPFVIAFLSEQRPATIDHSLATAPGIPRSDPSEAFLRIAMQAMSICQNLHDASFDLLNVRAGRESVVKILDEVGADDWDKTLMRDLLTKGIPGPQDVIDFLCPTLDQKDMPITSSSGAFLLIAQTATKICVTLNAESDEADNETLDAAIESVKQTLARVYAADENQALMRHLLIRGLSGKPSIVERIWPNSVSPTAHCLVDDDRSKAFLRIAMTARSICLNLRAMPEEERDIQAASETMRKTLADVGADDWNKALMRDLLIKGLPGEQSAIDKMCPNPVEPTALSQVLEQATSICQFLDVVPVNDCEIEIAFKSLKKTFARVNAENLHITLVQEQLRNQLADKAAAERINQKLDALRTT